MTEPLAPYPEIGLFIDGEWIHDRDAWTHVINPSTEATLSPVPKATVADLEAALRAAERGFLAWRDTPAQERVRILRKAVNLLRERIDAIACVLTLENGKPLRDARAEIERAGNFFEWDMAQSLRSYGAIVPGEPRTQKFVLREPIGPVFAVTPWNVPMSSAARKTSAALAAGCSIILKPAEETPATACALVKCFQDAGIPPGVVNLVLGDPAQISSTLVASPIVRLVTFTGSIPVGKHLSQLAAQAMKPVLMELGGHAPVLVSAGVDARCHWQGSCARQSSRCRPDLRFSIAVHRPQEVLQRVCRCIRLRARVAARGRRFCGTGGNGAGVQRQAARCGPAPRRGRQTAGRANRDRRSSNRRARLLLRAHAARRRSPGRRHHDVQTFRSVGGVRVSFRPGRSHCSCQRPAGGTGGVCVHEFAGGGGTDRQAP